MNTLEKEQKKAIRNARVRKKDPENPAATAVQQLSFVFLVLQYAKTMSHCTMIGAPNNQLS